MADTADTNIQTEGQPWRVELGHIAFTVPAWFQSAVLWVVNLPTLVLAGIAAAILAGFSFFVLFLGYMVGAHNVFPAPLFEKVDNKLNSWFGDSHASLRVREGTFETSLLNLSAGVTRVPVGGSDAPIFEAGGGVASFGGEIIVLPYSGTLFVSSGPGEVRETSIQAPDNNRQAYHAAADSPDMEDYTFDRGYLRYNDLAYYDTGSEQGFLASYIEYHSEDLCTTNTVAKLPFLDGATKIEEISAASEDWEIIFRTEPCLPLKKRYLALEGHMSGGRMHFVPPSRVYVTSSDFHWDGMRSDGELIAQNPEAEYGKVLEIDLETNAKRIVSMGHRNMQGIVQDGNGDLLVIEHGPKGGDEINRIIEGANYGWPSESYGTTYRGSPIPNAISYGRHETYEAPIYSWVPSVGTTAATLISGFNPAWDGDLLVGSLGGQSLFRIRMEGQDIIFSEPIEIGTRIRDVHQHTDGRLVLWTDNEELVFLEATQRYDEGAQFEEYLRSYDISSRLENRLRTAIDGCAECHSFTPDVHRAAPALGRVFGDPVASTDFGNYSDALKSKGGTWTKESLRAYLMDPQAFAPGTTMPYSGIDDQRTIDRVIHYLEAIDGHF